MASTSYKNQKLEKRKQELRDYKTGSKLGLEAFPDAESGEMKNMKVRMALFGMTGSGKSALINTVMKILCGKDEKGVAIEHLPGGEGTTILQEFLPQFNFRLIDTRGFFEFHSSEETELFRILYGTVREGEVIDRDQMGEVKRRLAGAGGHKLNKPPISHQVHVVLWVIKANDVRLTEDKYCDKFKFVTHMLKKECITVITVVTFDDTIKPEMRAEVIDKAREVTKSNKFHSFILANWLSNQDDYDAKYEGEVINMLHVALTFGERSIKVRQSKRSSTTRTCSTRGTTKRKQVRKAKPSTNMAEKTELSKEKGMETEQLRVHLFNCDKTYKFESIRALRSDVENESKWKFSVEEGRY